MVPLFSRVVMEDIFDQNNTIRIMNALMREEIIVSNKCQKCNLHPLSHKDFSTPQDVGVTTIMNSPSGTVLLSKNIRTVSNMTFIILTDDKSYRGIDRISKKYVERCGAMIVNTGKRRFKEFFFERYKTKIILFHSFTQRFYALINRMAYFDSQDFLFQDIVFSEDHEYSQGLTLFPERQKLGALPEYDEVVMKTKDSGGITPELLAEKGNINGCCGAGDPHIIATVFDLVLNDMNHYGRITDQSMLTYYAYNGHIPSLNLHPDALLMADQTPINTSVFGHFREINKTKSIKGQFKWLHHLIYGLPEEFLLRLYEHCPRDSNKVVNYFPGLSDQAIEQHDRYQKMKKKYG
ncbi:hypothetical protein TVAG_321760 [Trichomonas vaginalis G3]|uniref:Uncharacterized protein n=1 Tax=Trichomonas vaginalis (strain ATCC PRA-98 / G3) TaxID=412133 RepID=A2FQF4_TRIV3|nr:hypothetical protein TVAGG3_0482160 [Trichomonas vaginalis G3]EAX92862.1 hypothetical protein TVAG_321760 [Trichomonas vaginalis G3]KAI5515786.1 hypothetical protein TVAGG3_0482160 [Trichomonas vaginalis G3]|eukprot:XP_001305792.1 hypothetical protein [Trichomonas vaginalis G3]